MAGWPKPRLEVSDPPIGDKIRCHVPGVNQSRVTRRVQKIGRVTMLRFTLAVLAGGFVSSMTDWLFMGDLLYKHFNQYPEIWRVSGKQETKAILWSTPLPFVTCAVFDLICVRQQLLSYRATSEFAVAVWIAVPLPMLIVNSIWMKVSAPIAASYALGWLVKLLVAALSVVLILG